MCHVLKIPCFLSLCSNVCEKYIPCLFGPKDIADTAFNVSEDVWRSIHPTGAETSRDLSHSQSYVQCATGNNKLVYIFCEAKIPVFEQFAGCRLEKEKENV